MHNCIYISASYILSLPASTPHLYSICRVWKYTVRASRISAMRLGLSLSLSISRSLLSGLQAIVA